MFQFGLLGYSVDYHADFFNHNCVGGRGQIEQCNAEIRCQCSNHNSTVLIEQILADFLHFEYHSDLFNPNCIKVNNVFSP